MTVSSPLSPMRPVNDEPSVSLTLTSRSALRRQWRGSVSGRSTPREVTSSV